MPQLGFFLCRYATQFFSTIFQELNIEVYKARYLALEKECHAAKQQAAGSLQESRSNEVPDIFRQFVRGISIPDLEKEGADFMKGNEVITCLLDHIGAITKTGSRFPFKGCIKKIGSCWDCSKLGHVDEVDLLFVIDKDQVEINLANSSFSVIWCGKHCTPLEMLETFADNLDDFLANNYPQAGFQYSGYAATQYSGVRISGPAVTVLYQKNDLEEVDTISVDVTIALPFSCFDCGRTLHSDSQHWVKGLSKGIPKSINESLDLHLVPNLAENVWQPTTAHIEAELLHELETGSPAKKSHLLVKALIQTVDTFSFMNSLYGSDDGQRTLAEVTDALVCHLRAWADQTQLTTNQDQLRGLLNKCMRYAHTFLSTRHKVKYKELTKPHITVNKAAAKHSLLARVGPDDLKYKEIKYKNVFRLMDNVFEELAGTKSSVPHCISQNFANICKFSFWQIMVDRYPTMVSSIQRQYRILYEELFTRVGSESYYKSPIISIYDTGLINKGHKKTL